MPLPAPPVLHTTAHPSRRVAWRSVHSLFWGPQRALAAGAVVALLAALFLPPVAQHAHYHAFADQRSLWGVPHGGDVLSNLAFALAALWGAWCCAGVDAMRLSGTARALCILLVLGLWTSAAGSTYYHWAPADASLAWDRLGMGVAFAGLLGVAVHSRLDDRTAMWTAAAVLLAAPLAVAVWSHTGNLLPWSLLQGGGVLVVLALAWCPPRKRALPVAWGWVVAWYTLAKLLEWSDAGVFALTQGWVSGHNLKHVVAALAVWPVWQALRAQRVTQ